ncbi:craniofacial development protein 1 isoform X3 [Falco biarmicus]|uniref:craniofacial development protein 1 isoform X3 n=1 Tax=Falco cherrug TaxID=345164 RepID=UPI00247975F5|nr:craniofacial development protein 1 isoform X3 [Falco cherrug]XP_056216617.1 craniofacial development protein 1 isoform X3 [Falco biarmicus]
MSGSEEYSSAEDEDYVPSGAEYSEDDVSELVREEAADSPRPPRGRRSPRRPASRKRKKGGLLLEPDEKEEEKAQRNEEEEEEEVDSVEQVERNREEEEKKKEDALWASFLSDVGQKPKAGAATHVTQTKKAEEEKSGNKLQEKPKDSVKVTITKTFDFAGEEVRVTKEVDSNSKEAKSFLKQQEKWQSASPASLPTVSGLVLHWKPPSVLEQLEASGSTGEDSEYTRNWVLSIVQRAAVCVSGSLKQLLRQSLIALTLDAVVTGEVKEDEGLCYG